MGRSVTYGWHMTKYRLLQDLTFVGYKLFSKGQVVYEMPGYWHPDKVKICNRNEHTDFGCQTLVPRTAGLRPPRKNILERVEDET